MKTTFISLKDAPAPKLSHDIVLQWLKSLEDLKCFVHLVPDEEPVDGKKVFEISAPGIEYWCVGLVPMERYGSWEPLLGSTRYHSGADYIDHGESVLARRLIGRRVRFNRNSFWKFNSYKDFSKLKG